jgi:hypothetical protein
MLLYDLTHVAHLNTGKSLQLHFTSILNITNVTIFRTTTFRKLIIFPSSCDLKIIMSKNQPESVSCTNVRKVQSWLPKCGYQIQVTLGSWRVINYSQTLKFVSRNTICRNSARNIGNVVIKDAHRTNNEPTENDQPITQQKKKLHQHSVCVSTKQPCQSTKSRSLCS